MLKVFAWPGQQEPEEIKAETRSPIFRERRSIFEKTVGLVPTLRVALQPFANKIACAFVYGSIARREEHATSDVDLMVIGTVGLWDLAPSLRKAEERLGREVNVTNYSVDEFCIPRYFHNMIIENSEISYLHG
ncbi:MAG TPA: nucleotidyltransferase domain-containing protein [Candidatus Sulfotelmatobacter sp.]